MTSGSQTVWHRSGNSPGSLMEARGLGKSWDLGNAYGGQPRSGQRWGVLSSSGHPRLERKFQREEGGQGK